MDLAISVLALATALRTPLPRYFDLSPSRSSRASCSPVEAPEGTAARPSAPPSRRTSASTVGLPRESMTWRAWTRVIFVDMSDCSPEPMRIDYFTEECHGVTAARGHGGHGRQAGLIEITCQEMRGDRSGSEMMTASPSEPSTNRRCLRSEEH